MLIRNLGRKRISWGVRLIANAAAALLLAASSAGFSQEVVGVNTGPLSPKQMDFLRETEDYLLKRFGQGQIRFTELLSLEKMRRLIEEKKINYFISSAGFSRLISQTGSKELLTYADRDFPDSQRALGSLFLVRKDSGLNEFSDLKGAKFTANWPDGFYGYAVPMGEVLKRGYDPENFFGQVRYAKSPREKMTDILLNGEADVIALPACFWEAAYSKDSEERHQLKPIGLKTEKPCLMSTDTYPNWSISATANSSPEFTRALIAALLEMPKGANGGQWSILTDYSQVDRLFESLKIGPYAVLKNWTLTAFLQKYSRELAGLGVLLFLLLSLTLYLYIQLRRQTKVLVNSLSRQIESSERAFQANQRFSALQKVGVIGQMSSMIAHELRQPIGAIRAYCEALMLSSKRGKLTPELLAETLGKILEQDKKADQIIDRVRSYAKKRAVEKKSLPVIPLVEEAVGHFRASKSAQGAKAPEVTVASHGAFPPVCLIAPMEFELMISNLLKNSREAMEGQKVPDPKIFINISTEGKTCAIAVSDSGQEISGALLSALSAPLTTTKAEGMGLGIPIIRSIAANHGGKLILSKNGEHGGLKAVLILPLQEENGPAQE